MMYKDPREIFENLLQLMRFGQYLVQFCITKCLLLYLTNDITTYPLL